MEQTFKLIAAITTIFSICSVLIAVGGFIWQSKDTKSKVAAWEKRFDDFQKAIYRELYPKPGEVLYLTEERHGALCRVFKDEVRMLLKEYNEDLSKHRDASIQLAKAVAVLTVEVKPLSERREHERADARARGGQDG